MSQNDFGNLESPLSGSDFINGKLEPWRDTLYSGHSGTTRPSYIVAGMRWRDTSTTPWTIKEFDGANDIVLYTINNSTHAVRYDSANVSVNNSGWTTLVSTTVQGCFAIIETFLSNLTATLKALAFKDKVQAADVDSQTALNGYVMTANGSGGATFASPSNTVNYAAFKSKAPPQTAYVGANSISIASGVAFLSDQGTIITSTAVTKLQNATWAVGSGNGGMQSGSAKANNATQHLYAMYNPTTTTFDAQFVPNGTTFVPPSGYTQYRRIASFLTDSSGNFVSYLQNGDEFTINAISDLTGSAARTYATATLSVPKGLKLQVKGSINGINTGNVALVATVGHGDNNALTKVSSSLSASPGTAIQSTVPYESFTNTSGQVYIGFVGTSIVGYTVYTEGYVDKRGRDD